MLSPQQRAVPGIGSHLVPMILGVSEYGSPLEAYQRLTDPSSQPDISDQTHIMLGNILEAGTCALLAHVAGIEVVELAPTATFFHPRHKFMRAHPDRMVLRENAIVETKARGPWMRKAYTEADGEPLLGDYVQMQFQMACSGAAMCYHGVLFTSRDFLWWKVPRNDGDIEMLEHECERFWTEHILPRVPPEPQTEAEVKLRYPLSVLGKVVEGDAALEVTAGDALILREHIDELEELLEQKRVFLMNALGDADTLTYNGRVVCTYKSQTRKGVDVPRLREELPDIAAKYVKESSHRVLRIKSPVPQS